MDYIAFYISSLIAFGVVSLSYLSDSKEYFNLGTHVEKINKNIFKIFNNGNEYKLSSKCPHMGCSVDWNKDENKFICPCHQSSFDINGKLLNGPAKSDLEIIS